MATGKGHKGNSLLLAKTEQIALTQEQEDEWFRCADDAIHFVKTHMMIIHPDRGLIKFELWPWQEEMIRLYDNNRFVISRVARQSGKTSVSVAYILHLILFNEYKSVAILANKLSTAVNILKRLKLAYEHLPRWLQQGIVRWNEEDIELANGCKVFASATSDAGIRGETVNVVFLDEFAFVPPNVADNFYTSTYPVITAGTTTQVLIVSTPNGIGNLYHRMWLGAEKGTNGYVPFTVTWEMVPGRDKKFKEDTIKRTSLRQWNQEYGIEFLGSSDTLIEGEILKELMTKTVDPLNQGDEWQKYQEPQPGRNYVLVGDTARGREQNYSAFVIFDVSEIPYRIVAKYRNNAISPMQFPDKIYHYATMYNEAFVLLEIDGSGGQVADILYYDLEYVNMFNVALIPQLKNQTVKYKTQSTFGIKQTTKTKRIGYDNLKKIVEDGRMEIPDYDIVQELATFVVATNTYKAQEGCYDDLAMCLVMFAWLIAQRLFRETSGQDIFKALRGVPQDSNTAASLFQIPIIADSMQFPDNDKLPYSGQIVGREGGDLWFSTDDESSIDNPLFNYQR